MSFRVVYGRAGTGKSKFCFDEIKELSKNQGQKIYIIVPEQFSYATEKRLLDTLDNNATVNVEVISFKRLAYRVSKEVGETRTLLTKTAKAMVVKHVVEKNKSKLNFLAKANDTDLVLRTITEFKKHNIDVNLLKDKIEVCENKLLKLKLEDIEKIYNDYQEAIEKSFVDEEDMLSILANNISKTDMFDESIIYLDDFAGFIPQEYSIIEEILKKAKRVTIAICSDEIEFKDKNTNDIFYENKKTIKKLIEHAKNANVSIEEEVCLNEPFRFKNEELKALEKNIYSIKSETYDDVVKNIHLNLYLNPYEEIEEVAKKIINIVREKSLRYRDISIIIKNIEEYESIIYAIFSKYNIPIFIDSKKELNDSILIKYVLSIFDIYSKNWSKESVISYIKTFFLDISKNDIYRIENYCNKWQIRGNKWYKEDWNYDSLSKDLEELNELRRKIVDPLVKLNQELKNQKTADNISKKLYEFLEENSIKEKLNEKLSKIDTDDYKNEYISSYNILIDILDEIAFIYKDKKMTYDEFKDILIEGIKVSTYGEIPEALDQICIGDVERSRSHRINTSFILGINDGIYPSVNQDEGFLNDSDREELKNDGIEIAKGTIDTIYDEEFNIYKAFTTAENEIYLSYLSSDKEGGAKRPSVLISKIKKIFPKLEEASNVLKASDDIGIGEASFKDLLLNLRKLQDGEEIDEIWASVFNWYYNNEKYRPKLEFALKGFDDKNDAEKISESNIKRLYGDSLKTSISRLEQYKKCPFSFHLQYGLKLKEKEELRIKPIDTGSFMHDVIDTFFENTSNIKEITDEEIEKEVNNIIDEKLNISKNYIFSSTPKFKVLTNRLKKVVLQSIKYIVMQVQNSDFEIAGNEVEFKRKIGNVEILGKIDRIDELNTEDGKYIRIIDYKSSNKKIDLNEFLGGTQIQLITYLDSKVVEEGSIPAGMFYFNLIDPIIKSNRNADEEKIKEKIKKEFKLNGMILADINIIKKMDKNLESGFSDTVPVYIDTKGNISKSRSNAITKEEFSILQKRAQKIITGIGNEILSGNIEIKPVYSKSDKQDACTYCPYKTICRFDPKINDYSFIENKKNQEILDELKERKE